MDIILCSLNVHAYSFILIMGAEGVEKINFILGKLQIIITRVPLANFDSVW